MSYRNVEHRARPPKEVKTVSGSMISLLDEVVNDHIKKGWTPLGQIFYVNGFYFQQLASYHASYDTGPR